MRWFCLAAVAGLALLAGCDKSADVNTAITHDPAHAQARVIMLLPDANTLGAFISVPGDLPTAFDLSTASPGVTPFLSTVVGSWGFYVSKSEATLASVMEMPSAGRLFTTVVAPETSMGSSGALAVTWFEEKFAPSSSLALVRFVSGVPGLSGGTVTVAGTTLIGQFDPSLPTYWQHIGPGSVQVTITPPMGGTPLTFSNLTLAAGDLQTLALVGGLDASTAQLLTFNDSMATYGAMPAAPAVQVLTPAH